MADREGAASAPMNDKGELNVKTPSIDQILNAVAFLEGDHSAAGDDEGTWAAHTGGLQ